MKYIVELPDGAELPKQGYLRNARPLDIDDTVLYSGDMSMLSLCAERYALGRRTYIVYAICTIIKAHVRELEDKTVEVMIKDIENPYGGYGDKCDEQDWMSLLEALRKELERRENDR